MNPPVLYDAIGARLTDAELRAMVALHGGEALTQAQLHLQALLSAAEAYAGWPSEAAAHRLGVERARARKFLAMHPPLEPTL